MVQFSDQRSIYQIFTRINCNTGGDESGGDAVDRRRMTREAVTRAVHSTICCGAVTSPLLLFIERKGVLSVKYQHLHYDRRPQGSTSMVRWLVSSDEISFFITLNFVLILIRN